MSYKLDRLLLKCLRYVTCLSSCRYRSHHNMPDMRVLLLSSSNVHGHEFMQYAADDIKTFLAKSDVSRVLFVPYAQLDHNGYHEKVGGVFRKWGLQCDSIHKLGEPVKAVDDAEAIFIGGGNTFLLLRALYEHGLVEAIRRRVLENGVPYIGSSAGTNVATVSICTTNDMPIVHVPRLEALGLVPFNINPHYVEGTGGDGKHRGETREERILQYLELPTAPSVLAMREGCTLHVEGGLALLQGLAGALLFEPGYKPKELPVGSNVSHLFSNKLKLCAGEN